jgi:NADPH:quinone reductase
MKAKIGSYFFAIIATITPTLTQAITNTEVFEMMKVVALNGFGSIESFQDELREEPIPKEGELKIRIKAAGFNPVDWKIRKNWYGGDPKQVMGCECSGIIDAIGPGEKQFAVGNEVYALTFRSSNGSYAEFSCVPRQLVAKKPSNISFVEASTVPLAAMTAYRATLAVASVKPEDTVFVAGIGGGVGSFALQFLLMAGVKEIYTVAKNEESAQFLVDTMNIPKDHILIYEGLSYDDLKEKILAMNRMHLFDATFDLVGGEMKRLCLELTGLSGHFSTIVPESNFNFPFWEENSIPRGRNLSVHQVAIGAELGSTAKNSMDIYARHLEIITKLMEEGRLLPPHVTIVGWLEAKTVKKAHLLLETSRVKGKLVMIVEN